jgi:hypothetical protein
MRAFVEELFAAGWYHIQALGTSRNFAVKSGISRLPGPDPAPMMRAASRCPALT